MVEGCSEISMNIIVKYVQHVGIIWTFCLLWGELLIFSVREGDWKNYWVVVCKGVVNTQAGTTMNFYKRVV